MVEVHRGVVGAAVRETAPRGARDGAAVRDTARSPLRCVHPVNETRDEDADGDRVRADSFTA